MIRFTLRQLEYALAVQERSSFARAAEFLGVAQPSVSAAIAKLEEQVGLQIFIRHHAQGVAVTPEGTRFLSDARSLLGHAADIARAADTAANRIEGTLSISSFITLAPAYVPRILAGFRQAYPKVTVKLEEGTQEKLLEGLRSGRHDLALLYSVDLPDDLEVTRLASVKPYVLLPARHRLAQLSRVSLKQLADEPLVLLDVQPSRTYFLRILENAGLSPRIAFSSPSLEVVRGLVSRGLGYSVLVTRPDGDKSYDGEKLAARPIADKTEDGVIVLARLKQQRKTRLVSAFEEHCVSTFQALRKG